MKSFSQFGEDAWILKHLPLPKSGFFVEVGAYDGVASSNTFSFEEEGWNGICVEPDPEIAALCRNRRRCLTLCCAVSNTTGTRPFFINRSDRGQSGFLKDGDEIKVPTRKLDEIFNLHGVPVDILSIDTEGTELDCWASAKPHRPTIVILEFLTWGSPPRDKQIVAQMTQDGYSEVHRTEANLIFLRK